MKILRAAAWFIVIGAASPRASLAQTSSAPGTLLVAHGADSSWNARVIQLAAMVNTGGPVEVSFLMGSGPVIANVQTAVERLERRGAREIVVVPLLVSSHSDHYQQIRYLAGVTDSLGEDSRYHLEMAGQRRTTTRLPVRVTAALDDADELAEVLSDRAVALSAAPGSQALFLIAHGPNSSEEHAAWMSNLRRIGERVRQRSGFRDVRVDLMKDDAPAPVRAEAIRRIRDVIELQAGATGKDVVVVPVLISSGGISRSKVPADLAGLPIVYRGEPLLSHPAMARWVEAIVKRSSSLPATSQPH